MAYIVSPYAKGAEFPSDNTPAQLLQQGLQAGYQRRMKEMEQKMKLQEEGKKARDKAFEFAKIDLSQVHPVYQPDIKKQAEEYAKLATEEYSRDASTFPYNTKVAEAERKLTEAIGVAKQLSTKLTSEENSERALRKEGKFNVAPNEYGAQLQIFNDPTKSIEEKEAARQLLAIGGEKFNPYSGGALYNVSEKVAPYTWDDYAKEIENLKTETDKRKISFPQKETVIATVMNDENKKTALAKQIGLDISTPEGIETFRKRLSSYLPESQKSAPTGGGGYMTPQMQQFSKPAPGQVTFKGLMESTGGGTEMFETSVTSPYQFSFSTAMPTALVQPAVAYDIMTGKPLNQTTGFKDSKMVETNLSKIAVLPVYKQGVTRSGGKNISGQIVDDANLQDPRMKDKIEYKVFSIGQTTKEIGTGSSRRELIADVRLPIDEVKGVVWDKLAQGEKSFVAQNIQEAKKLAEQKNKELSSTIPKKEAAGGDKNKNNLPKLKIGDVRNGYIFLGGDANKPSSWKKQ